MGFLEQMLDPTITQDSTPVPQFKLNYHYGRESVDLTRDLGEPTEENTHLFFVRSEQYFRIKYGALATNKNLNGEPEQLAIEITHVADPEHYSDVSAPTRSFQSSQDASYVHFNASTHHIQQPKNPFSFPRPSQNPTALDDYSNAPAPTRSFQSGQIPHFPYERFQTLNTSALHIQQPKTNLFSIAKHSKIVEDHVKIYQQKSAALVQLDQKILSAMLIAIGATCVPFIPFMGLVSIAGWMATFYLLNQRAERYIAYQDALTLLVGTCNWALGTPPSSLDAKSLAEAPAIVSMMECLYPVLSKTQIKHLIADEIEETYAESLKKYDERFKYSFVGRFFTPQSGNRVHQAINRQLESTALKQRGAEFVRCVYGLNRGTAKDFLLVAANALPDIWHAFLNVTRALCTTPAEDQSENLVEDQNERIIQHSL